MVPDSFGPLDCPCMGSRAVPTVQRMDAMTSLHLVSMVIFILVIGEAGPNVQESWLEIAWTL